MNVKGIIMDGDNIGAAGDTITNWGVKDDDSIISIGSIISEEEEDYSMNSECSSSSNSSELAEDASSSSSSSLHSNGPLYELSELMNNLPIKRGLSMFYEGKSQSFTSLARVESIDDLAKEKTSHYYRKKMMMKSCKSYGRGLDNHRISSYYPKATIKKKGNCSSSRGSFASLVTRKGSFLGGTTTTTRPSISVHKNF